MRQIDMSAEAVTARLKLASELRRVCLKLAAAKIRERDDQRADQKEVKDRKNPPQHQRE